jgi:hypothetical protein
MVVLVLVAAAEGSSSSKDEENDNCFRLERCRDDADVWSANALLVILAVDNVVMVRPKRVDGRML